jgi:hypothetical protein
LKADNEIPTRYRNELQRLIADNQIETVVSDDEEGSLTYAELLKKRERKKAKSIPQNIQNLDWIPPTSVICEREFSIATNVYTANRQSMDPTTLEMILFLKFNRNLWSLDSMSRIVQSKEQDKN